MLTTFWIQTPNLKICRFVYIVTTTLLDVKGYALENKLNFITVDAIQPPQLYLLPAKHNMCTFFKKQKRELKKTQHSENSDISCLRHSPS